MVLLLTFDQLITYLKPLEYEVGCRTSSVLYFFDLTVAMSV